jgi:SAM-dependent methyltransferase
MIKELFGASTPWLFPALSLITLVLIVAAFREGRSISLWPPRIGRRQVAPEPPLAPEAAGRGPTAGVDREYPVEAANDFYQEIATTYDLRNSGNLVTTHLATVAHLQALRERRPALRVLDLGGGTGKLVAIPFFNDPQISWTYVDRCPAMAAEFRRNLAGYPLVGNATVIVDDLHRVLPQLEPGRYDVVVLSLVLSSMPDLVDFAALRRLLAPDGVLLVADINPGYTRDNPLYKVWVDGSVVALRTTPVEPLELLPRATGAGLRLTGLQTIGSGGAHYSFLAEFHPQPVESMLPLPVAVSAA